MGIGIDIVWSGDFNSGEAAVPEDLLDTSAKRSHLFLGLVFCFPRSSGLHFTYGPRDQGNDLDRMRRDIQLGGSCSPFIPSKGSVFL